MAKNERFGIGKLVFLNANLKSTRNSSQFSCIGQAVPVSRSNEFQLISIIRSLISIISQIGDTFTKCV